MTGAFFQSVSARTAGLSTGITPALHIGGKAVLIFTMFAGRVGLFTLLSMWIGRPVSSARYDKHTDVEFPAE